MNRPRTNVQGDAEASTINHLLVLRDVCALFDTGHEHQFFTITQSLRSLCHNGQGKSLLHIIGENGRLFPSSVSRDFKELANAASDHFVVSTCQNGPSQIYPRLELTRISMKERKFKNWWQEEVVTDQAKRGLSRGGIVIAVAHNDAVHFNADVDELYDDLARQNGLGLFAEENGSWRSFGLAPIQAIIRQIAHEFLLGMDDWIRQRDKAWQYKPIIPKIDGHTVLAGFKLYGRPVQPPGAS